MTTVNDQLAPVYDILGKKLDDLNLVCEMMMFSFGKLELHAQCFTRIVKNGDILATTQDYQSWDGATDTNNDEWYFIKQYKDEIIGGAVQSIQISPAKDVLIKLDNGVQIEVFVANGYHHYAEENEQWVYFKHRDKTYPYIAVYNKTVEVTRL